MRRLALAFALSLSISTLFAADLFVLVGDRLERYDTTTGAMTLSFGSGHGLGFTGGFSAHGLGVRTDGTVAVESIPSGTFGPHQYAIFNGSTGQHLRSFNVGTLYNAGPVFGENGLAHIRDSATGQPANGIRQYNIDTGEDLGHLLAPGNSVIGNYYGAIWNRGRMLVNDGSNQYIRHLNPITGELVGTLVDHSASMGSMAFSNDGSTLFVGSFPDQQVRKFHALTGQYLGDLLQGSPRGRVGQMFAADGKVFVGQEDTTTFVKSLNVYNELTGEYIQTMNVGDFKSFAIAVPTNPVPEPATIIAVGIGAVAFLRKRK